MRIAALYDIHDNLPALETVLAEVENSSVDLIVIGGDAVGFSDQAGPMAAWLAGKLSAAQHHFLQSWTTNYHLEASSGNGYFFCHPVPDNDMDVFTSQTASAELEAVFGAVNADIAICGHTHMQFRRQINGLAIVNAGSVGIPFGKIGADWLLLEDGQITFKHTDYDLEAAAARIRATDYPQAEQFAANNVLRSPSTEQALQSLATLAETWQGKNRPANHSERSN